MLKLVKNTLRFHTFNRFFFIGAAMLLFLGVRYAAVDAGSYSIEVMTQGIPITCIIVIINADNEKRSGGFRNKLIAGYTKRQVFFADILSAAACGAALFLVIGIPLYTSIGSPKTLMTVLMIFVLSAVVSACLAINLSNIIFPVLGIIVIMAVCVVIADPVQDALEVDKYNYRYVFDQSKADDVGIREATTLEKTTNPEYPTGVKRAVLKTLAYANSFSQLLYVEDVLSDDEMGLTSWNSVLDHEYDIKYIVSREYYFFPLITLGLSCAVACGGYLSFRRKDLN